MWQSLVRASTTTTMTTTTTSAARRTLSSSSSSSSSSPPPSSSSSSWLSSSSSSSSSSTSTSTSSLSSSRSPTSSGLIRVLTTRDELRAVLPRLLRARYVGFDLEGVRLHEDSGVATLMQLADADEQRIYLVDLLALGARTAFDDARALLESEATIKIVHDCRQEARHVHRESGVRLAGVFDTQVAERCVSGDERLASLSTLVERYFGLPMPEKAMVRRALKLHDGYWRRRPLSHLQIAYAAKDVRYLQPLLERQAAALRDGDVAEVLARSAVQVERGIALDQKSFEGVDVGNVVGGIL